MIHVAVWDFCGGCVCTTILLAAALPASKAVAEEDASLMAKLYWDQSVLRAERDEVLWLYVEDLGNVRPSLTVKLKTPAGVDLLDDAVRKIPASAWEQQRVFIGGRRKMPSVMEPHPATRISWRLRSDQPVSGEVEVMVSGDGAAASDALTAVFREALAPVKAPYVPEPRAVDSERLVGMIYCPLWKPGDHYGWHMMARSMPWRKPALGWYDESLAEVTDWEIKWNVEHGVDFLFYCWYRAYGNEGKPVEQMLSHAIHDGLFNARYGDRIKFCIMWTNTDYSGIASLDDLMDNLMPFWIETYFKRSNYLIIDNKPVLSIYDIRRLIKDLGSNAAVKNALDLMRAACVKEGFDGLWITGESRHWWPDYLRTMAKCGFDASFAYVWNNVPDGASEKLAHETILSNHRKRIEWNLLPDIPTVSAMWDPSLWEQYAQPGRSSAHYRMSPEGFRRVCEDVKALTDALPENSLARRMILVDNWNEWGEGHYLAPCREHGFEYLDVLRQVFTNAPREHTDLVPEDVGLGPYETAYETWLDEMRKAPAPPHQPQSRLHTTLRINWVEDAPFPWTYNGGVVGRIGDHVVYIGGFGRQVPDRLKQKPGYFDGYHRLLAVWDVTNHRWEQAEPLFPGTARAYANYATSDGRYAYVLGGQSYVAPYCFRDVYRLSRDAHSWKWERLPDMLMDTADFDCVEVNGKLYVQGGANYEKTGPHLGWDSEVGAVGKHLETLDLSRLQEGWKRLPDMPGTHRSHHAVAAVKGKIYVLGGVASVGGKQARHWNNVDNWRYDPERGAWEQLRDLPFPCGGWSAKVFRDRYVLLFGGFYGRKILALDGSTREAYGCDKAAFSNRVLVYDTATDTFAEATPMPKAVNDTRLVWLDDTTVANITGEVPGGRIPCVFIGRIVEEHE